MNKSPDKDSSSGKVITISESSIQRDDEGDIIPKLDSEEIEDEYSVWNKKSIFYTWLLLCYSTGPVASMSRTYVPASIQSIARSVGRTKDGRHCAMTGNDCYVKFGVGTVHYTSYVLYLRAIATAVEGVVAIFLMGIADYSNYRKLFVICSILIYGCFALPFAGLTQSNYPTLKAASALYALMSIDDSIYQIMEGSYIPLFMRADKKDPLKRGSIVSVLGIVIGNVGGLTALIIGIIISYTSGRPDKDGYHNFLLAITIAGCLTVVLSIFSSFYIPSVKGKKRDSNVMVLPFKRFFGLLKDIQQYPMAFLYCVSWVIWNVSYSNFMSMFLLLFRSTLGLGSTDSEYTVYTFMSYISASLGSLAWMVLYPRFKFNIKYWGYMFLAFSIFSNFWGCLGIHHATRVGFQHRWEFWIFEVFYAGTSSAMRSLNRCVYSLLLPKGDEAQYFGLEIMLGVATGWIGSLVNAVIQDRTNDDRFPFLPNMFLAIISIVLYFFVDLENGMAAVNKAKQPQEENED